MNILENLKVSSFYACDKINYLYMASNMGARIPPMAVWDKAMTGIPQLLDDLHRLSEDQESADVVFVLGREEERVYAHRILLMARCNSFKLAKRSDISLVPGSTVLPAVVGGPTPIRLPQVSADVFRQFMLYVYTAKIMLQDSKVFEMMALAHDMGAEELKTACEDHVISTLSVINACTFLAAAMEIQEKSSGGKSAVSLMEKCITFINENASECVKTASFLNLSKEGLIKLISSDYLSLEEENVWRCVLAWAKHKAGVTQPTVHWAEEERMRVCQNLQGVIGHVRLLLIDSQVFAEEVEPTGAVPIELSLERYRYAALHSNKMDANQIISTPSFSSSSSNKRLQPRFVLNMFPGSVILKSDKLHLQGILNGWYGERKQMWRLLFRASTHGFNASAFHHHCDGVAPIFVIALGFKGDIAGGFSDVAWAKTTRKGGYIHSERAFLFALNTKEEGTQKFDIIKKPYAICYHPECGPVFGAGADLFISSGCNSNLTSYSNLPHSYDGPNANSSSLFGDYHFMLADYEVFTLASTSTYT